MGDATSDSTSTNNIPAFMTGESSSELRSDIEYSSTVQDLTQTGIEKRANSGENGYQHEAKRVRMSPHNQVNLDSEKSRNTKPIMTAQVVVSLNQRQPQKKLPTKYQINGKISCPNLPSTSANLMGNISGSSSLYPSTMSQTLESQGNCGNIMKTRYKEGESSGQTEPETSKIKPPEHSLMKEVKTDATSERVTSPRTTPPPRLRRDVSSGITPVEPISNMLSKTAFKSFLSTPGYLAKHCRPNSNSLSTPSCSKTNSFATPPGSLLKTPYSCPGRIDSVLTNSSPKVRLSLSLNGKAELITEKSSSSPIKSTRPRSSSGNLASIKKGNLRRSKSEFLPCVHQSGIGHFNTPLVSRRSTGRSRDARSWVYCCKGEIHDELLRQVENESFGSAVAAISLIRATNTPSKIFSPKKYSNNFITKSEIPPYKKTRSNSKASDQTNPQHATPSSLALSTYNHDSAKDFILMSPSEDSDKENWFPLKNGSPYRRPLPIGRQDKLSTPTRIHYGNQYIQAHEIDLGIIKGRKQKLNDSFVDACRDRTQLKVLRGVGRLVNEDMNSCKTGDLGAIQGLLSLSQGNWR